MNLKEENVVYYNELIQIIDEILKDKIDKKGIGKYLSETFDYEKIYDSDDELLTDAFFTLTHYASGEEEINKTEWTYLMDCLLGKSEYSLEKKLVITYPWKLMNLHKQDIHIFQ